MFPVESRMKVLVTRHTSKSKLRLDSVDHGELLEKHVKQENCKKQLGDVSLCQMFILLFSLVSFVFDVGSDCYLIATYFIQGDIIWFALTLSFVLVPSVLMSLFSFIWYWMDDELLLNTVGGKVRLVFHFAALAPIVRYVDTLIYAWNSRMAKDKDQKSRYYCRMLCEEADSAMLRMMECTMESSPQLLLQLYILFTQKKVNNIVLLTQSVSSGLSLISLSWCLAAYQSSLRETTDGKMKMNTKSMVLMVMWKTFVVSPRFFSIALFTTVFNKYVLLILGTHYIFMAVYIFAQGTTFFSEKKFSFKEIMFALVVAVIYCVDYLNIKEGHARIRYTLFYAISFGEISIFLLLWFYYPPIEGKQYYKTDSYDSLLLPNFNVSNSNVSSNYFYQMWPFSIRITVVCVTIGAFLLSLILMIVYYLYCHPTNNIKMFLDASETQFTPTPSEMPTAGDSLMAQTNLENNPTMLREEAL